MALVQKEVETTTSNVLLRGDILMSMYLSLKSKQIPQLIIQVDC